jgi:PAS domain S-box-containing protein
MKRSEPAHAGNLVLLALLLAGLTMIYLLDTYQTGVWQRSRISALESRAGILEVRLRNALVSRINSTELLAALLRLHPETSPEEFDHFARNLYSFNPSLRALQFADSTTQVRYVYPPQGNEITIRVPMVLIEDPLRGGYVKKAIQEKIMTVQPPFELRQGGLGIAVRNPVFLDDGDFFGLAIAVLDVSSILDDTLQTIDSEDIAISIADSDGTVFWRQNELFGHKEERTVDFVDSTWTVKISHTADSASLPFMSRHLLTLLAGLFLLSVLILVAVLQHGSMILKRRVAERTRLLAESENRFRSIIENSGAGYFRIDKDGLYEEVNRAWLDMHGYDDKSEILRRHYSETQFSGDAQTADDIIELVRQDARQVSGEFSRLRKDGSVQYHMFAANPYYENGDVAGIEGFLLDTSQRRKAEEEKEYLLKELNHRVKNNLMIISSLVSMKDAALGPDVDLTDIRNQIDAVRIVHEKLDPTDDIRRISLRGYIEEILSQSLGPYLPEKLVLKLDIEDLTIPTKQAVPVGLIVNELATNTIKYGLSENQRTEFRVTLQRTGKDNHIVLRISNSGAPLPDTVRLDNPTTLGLRLIKALVSQLEGTVELDNTVSPSYLIQFPLG